MISQILINKHIKVKCQTCGKTFSHLIFRKRSCAKRFCNECIRQKNIIRVKLRNQHKPYQPKPRKILVHYTPDNLFHRLKWVSRLYEDNFEDIMVNLNNSKHLAFIKREQRLDKLCCKLRTFI